MNSLQKLTNDQYEKVLRYMESTNQQAFQKSLETLTKFNFNVDQAISNRLSEQHLRNFDSNISNTSYDEQRRKRKITTKQQIQRYINYRDQKQRKSIFSNISQYIKNIVIQFCVSFIQVFFPNVLLHKFYHSLFYNQWKPKTTIKFKDRSLSYYINHSYLSPKPIMFIISTPKINDQCFNQLFINQKIVNKINQSFIFCGSFSNDKQCNKIQGNKNSPQIIICRVNIYQQLQIIRRYANQVDILKIDVDQLNYELRHHQQQKRKDNNTIKIFQRYLRKQYAPRMRFEQQQQQQQQMYQQKDLITSSMIKTQNEQYKKVQKQQLIKEQQMRIFEQKQKQQNKKHLQLLQSRKIKKQLIPKQPQQGDIIRFNFRCPNGTALTRNFNSTQKLQLLYNWVQTNQNIEFQDNKKKLFQLLYGFPPMPLAQKKQQLLKDIFDSDQEKIIIKEL